MLAFARRDTAREIIFLLLHTTAEGLDEIAYDDDAPVIRVIKAKYDI